MNGSFGSPLSPGYGSPVQPESPSVFGLEDELNAAILRHDNLTEQNEKLRHDIMSISSQGKKSLNVLHNQKRELLQEYENLKKNLETIPDKNFLLSQQQILEEYIKIFCANSSTSLNLSPLYRYGILHRTDTLTNLNERIGEFSRKYEKWKVLKNLWPLKFIFDKDFDQVFSDEEKELIRQIILLDSATRGSYDILKSEKENLETKLSIHKDDRVNYPDLTPKRKTVSDLSSSVDKPLPYSEVQRVVRMSGAKGTDLMEIKPFVYKLGKYTFTAEKRGTGYYAVLDDNKKVLLPFLVKEYLNEDSSFILSS